MRLSHLATNNGDTPLVAFTVTSLRMLRRGRLNTYGCT